VNPTHRKKRDQWVTRARVFNLRDGSF